MAKEHDRDHSKPKDDLADRDGVDQDGNEGDELHPNPPRTTTKHMTAPKFGSAGSGGAELEPGPERD